MTCINSGVYKFVTLTFILACLLCCIISIGIVVAVAAGVAYGYNYSMAEFLTFTRQDTTVYMRRGQFYDKPDFDTDNDVVYPPRRSAGGPAEYSIKNSMNDQDTGVPRSEDKDLRNTWGTVNDVRKYAELLTKQSRKSNEDILRAEDDSELTGAQPPVVTPYIPLVMADKLSVNPNPRIVPTTYMDNGYSQIVMRNFKPILTQPPATRTVYQQPVLEMAKSGDEYSSRAAPNSFYADEEVGLSQTKLDELPLSRLTLPASRLTLPYVPPVPKRRKNKDPYVHMRRWGSTTAPMKPDPELDYKEDVDEDNVVYKPI